MTKHLFTICLVASVLFAFCTTADAQRNRRNREQKEYVWDWNHTPSGNAEFDHYLYKVDTLWNNIKEYQQVYETFTYKIDTLMINGTPYLMAYMEDKDGNMATINRVNWQIYNCVLAGTNIVLDATNASLLTASATLALASMDFITAAAYTKYIKGGPMVIDKGMKEMKKMNEANKANKASWKAMKNGAIDPATLGIFSEEAVKKMKKCCRIKPIIETDPEYATVMEVSRQKTDEEIQQDLARTNDKWESSVVLPEDANQSLDNTDDWSDVDEA